MDGLDADKLVEEAAKVTGEETPLESAAEETSSEEKTEETQSKETSEDTTSLKSEEETKGTEEETKDEGFNNHPAWIKREEKLKNAELERDEALEKAQSSKEMEQALDGMSVGDITRLSKSAKLLNQYPELADKVKDIIEKHPYGNEETNSKISVIEQRLEESETKATLREYDTTVNSLIKDNKVPSEIEPVVRELLDNRVASGKVSSTKDISSLFDKVLKDVDLIRRKALVSYGESKKGESKVPMSPAHKGKVMVTKKESAEAGDIIEELARGIKASSEPVKE